MTKWLRQDRIFARLQLPVFDACYNGTFLSSKNENLSKELKSDGTFAVHEKDKTTVAATGSYKVEGTVITFNLKDADKQASGKIAASTLTDPDGVTWVKQ